MKTCKMVFTGTCEEDGPLTHKLATDNLNIGKSYDVTIYSDGGCSVFINESVRHIYLPRHSFTDNIGKIYGLR